MLFYIEIAEESLALITSLNNGVEPKIEKEGWEEMANDPSFFVYNTDPDGHNDIISLADLEKAGEDADKIVTIPVFTLG